MLQYNVISPFHALGFFLYLLKTLENQRFSDVFRGYRKRPVVLNRLSKALVKEVRDMFVGLPLVVKRFVKNISHSSEL